MVLARPMEFGQMLHALGQKEVADFRKDKSKPLELPSWATTALPAPAEPAVDAEFTEVPPAQDAAPLIEEPVPQEPERTPQTLQEFEELNRSRTAAAFAKAKRGRVTR